MATENWEKKKQFADHSRVRSISDSSFKFLFEDHNSTLKYVTQHNLEHDIRLRRGFTAAQIVDLAEDQLQQLASNGVKDIIATFGAVDISNFRTAQDKEPGQLAQSVAESVLQFVTIAKSLTCRCYM